MFNVITDLKRIARLNMRLGKRLREHLKHVETRTITSPGGKYPFQVHFERQSGDDSPGWATGKHTPDKLRNYFVFGKPGGAHLINIAVQINFPAAEYKKALAGVFIEDENGNVYLAHRGKLTGTGGAFKTLQVLDRLANCISAIEDGKKSVLALIGGLEDVALVSDLFRFAAECRNVVRDLAAERELGKTAENQKVCETNASELVVSVPKTAYFMRLSDYFEEFAGESVRCAVTAGVRVVRHGRIVAALAKGLTGKGEARKSIAIDLAVVRNGYVDLYEVKTSSSTTDIYTGLGQLLLHGEAISNQLDLPVRRYLVLPSRPKLALELPMVNKYEINIITFVKTGERYVFT